MTLRIIIADRHPLVRHGLQIAINQRAAGEVVGVATSGSELESVLNALGCDVLVGDFAVDDFDDSQGICRLADVRARHPVLPIVLMTRLNGLGMVDRALERGATCFLDKACAIEEVVTALSAAARWERYISADLVRRRASRTCLGKAKSA